MHGQRFDLTGLRFSQREYGGGRMWQGDGEYIWGLIIINDLEISTM